MFAPTQRAGGGARPARPARARARERRRSLLLAAAPDPRARPPRTPHARRRRQVWVSIAAKLNWDIVRLNPGKGA